MVRERKWIGNFAPDARTSEVAARTLRLRLTAVEHYLPLAAEKSSENVEHVHQLRVATRRAMAAAKLYKDMLPRRRGEKMRNALKQIRQAAGEARDYDVLHHRIAEENSSPQAVRFLEIIRQRRCEAQQPLLEVFHELMDNDTFPGHISKLLSRVRPRSKKANRRDPLFGEWARENLRPFLKKFFKAATIDTSDLQALHQFRLRGKQLRYAMELLAGAFPPAFRKKLYPVVEELQEKLGAVNDHVTAKPRFQQWIEDIHEPEIVDYLRILLDQEGLQLEQSLQVYVAWWTWERQRDLQRRFDKMLSETGEAVGA